MAPSRQAAIDRLQKEGLVDWLDTTGTESRAFLALAKKGLVLQITPKQGRTYFKLPD